MPVSAKQSGWMRMSRKDKRTDSHKAQRITKTQMTLAFALSVGALTFLSFISVPLALGAFGAGSFAVLVWHERMQRGQWQQAIDFKLKRMSEKHDALARAVIHDRQALDDLQLSIKHSIKRQSVSYETLVKGKPSPKPALRADNDHRARNNNMDDKPYLRPLRAVKNQMTKPPPKISSPLSKHVSSDDGSGLSDMVVTELLNHAVRDRRIDVFLQPIVRLPQRQRRFYEVYARVRAKPGVYIPAGRYKKLAERNGVMHDLDFLLLQSCLTTIKQTAAHADMPAFFINITGDTLRNGSFMNSLLAFVAKNRNLAARLVFEIQHADFLNMDIAELKILSGLGKLGVRFSIDHVQSLDIDVPDLQRFNVRFVKADAKMFLDARSSQRAQAQIWKYKRLLEGNGIGLIIEKIENEGMMREIIDFDPHFGQGFLFGRPDVQGAYEPDFQRKARSA